MPLKLSTLSGRSSAEVGQGEERKKLSFFCNKLIPRPEKNINIK
jgi:hypothetical protein